MTESEKEELRQQKLAGIKDKKVEALEECAEDLEKVRRKRMSLQGEEGQLEGKLIELMKAAKTKHYQLEATGTTFKLAVISKEKIQMTKKDESENGDKE